MLSGDWLQRMPKREALDELAELFVDQRRGGLGDVGGREWLLRQQYDDFAQLRSNKRTRNGIAHLRSELAEPLTFRK